MVLQQIYFIVVVDLKVELVFGVVIGLGVVVGFEVVIGENIWIGFYVVLDGWLILGCDNKVYLNVCFGFLLQDFKYCGVNIEVLIGDGNMLWECVMINCVIEEGELICIGNGNLLMVYCYLGYNCDFGNNIVMLNVIQVVGYVVIEDCVVVGGCLGIYQFVYIGGMVMVGGMICVDWDVFFYCLVEGYLGRVWGLNCVGLRCSGLVLNYDGVEFKQFQEIWILMYCFDLVIVDVFQWVCSQFLLLVVEYFCQFFEVFIGQG